WRLGRSAAVHIRADRPIELRLRRPFLNLLASLTTSCDLPGYLSHTSTAIHSRQHLLGVAIVIRCLSFKSPCPGVSVSDVRLEGAGNYGNRRQQLACQFLKA